MSRWVALAFLGLASPAFGQDLLVDFVDTPLAGDSASTDYTSFGGSVYFRNAAKGGYELWKSDGTSGGTTLVQSWPALQTEALELGMTEHAGELYFWTASLDHGWEIWKTDGTTLGTVRVTDVATGPADSLPETFATFSATSRESKPVVSGGLLYFSANDNVNGTELWSTDGTPDAESLVADIRPGPADSYPGDLVDYGGTLYFLSRTFCCVHLTRVDASPPGYVFVASYNHSGGTQYADNLNVVNSWLVFAAPDPVAGYEPIRSDGTALGTSVLADLSATDSDPEHFSVAGNLLYFTARTNSAGRLHVTDGTPGGTLQLVTTFFTDAVAGLPDGRAIFNRLNPEDLWVTDGTVGGTQYFADIPNDGFAGPTFIEPELVTAGSLVYFMTEKPGGSRGLVRSDGTALGTFEVADVVAPPIGGFLEAFSPVGAKLWFNGRDAVLGREPWSTDGTVLGTAMVKSLVEETTEDGGTSVGRRVGDDLFFVAFPGFVPSLYRSDGTLLGTQPIVSGSPFYGTMMAVQGRLFYVPGGTEQLWVSNGTAGTTSLVYDFVLSSTNLPGEFTDGGDVLYFKGQETGDPVEIWRSDGTPSGTFPLTVGNAEISFGFSFMAWIDDHLYFRGFDNQGTEPWISDGTVGGTQRLANVNVGFQSGQPRSSFPQDFVQLGSKVYFIAETDSEGREVWSTEGTEATTALAFEVDLGPGGDVQQLVATDTKLLVAVRDNLNRAQLWSSDGTQGGLQFLHQFADDSGNVLGGMRRAGSKVYFWGEYGGPGSALWTSDGTVPGTFVLETFPLFNSPTQQYWDQLALGTGDQLVFGATQESTGGELWLTDGTIPGTQILTEGLNPGTLSSNPTIAGRAGANLFVTLDTCDVGREIHTLSLGSLDAYVFETLGRGCAGTGGLRPKMALTGVPRQGNAVGIGLEDAPAFAGSLLLYSPTTSTTPLGACTYYIESPFFYKVKVTSASGTANQNFTIPFDPTLVGAGLYFQWMVVDPAGPLFGPATLSDVAELRIGG